jgi:hypothetical protein
MKKLNSIIIVDKNDDTDAKTVMNKIFTYKEDDQLFNNIYKTIEWKMSEWFIKKGITQKKEDIYIYVETLPDYFKSYTVENDKYLRVCIKHKIKVDDVGYKKIKSKFFIKNIKSKYRNIINGLDLIKIINYMEINDIPNTKLINVNLNTEIKLSIPYKDDFENYLANIFETINENFRTKLTREV